MPSAAAVRSTLAARAVRSNSALGPTRRTPVAPAARGASAARVYRPRGKQHIQRTSATIYLRADTYASTGPNSPQDAAHSSFNTGPRGPERRPFRG